MTIEPLAIFKASEVSGVEDVIDALDAGSEPIDLTRLPRGKPGADAPLPEPVQHRLTRALHNARKHRKH